MKKKKRKPTKHSIYCQKNSTVILFESNCQKCREEAYKNLDNLNVGSTINYHLMYCPIK